VIDCIPCRPSAALFGAGFDRAGVVTVQGRTNIMTLGWHTVLEFTPSLVGNCGYQALTIAQAFSGGAGPR
jgi:flavin reductase (DIM6/NTAB) family NADH-FMN oxidoreductase RutF